MTFLLGAAQVSHATAQRWATDHDATDDFASLARYYWNLAPFRGRVRPEVAYAHAAQASDFGRELDESLHNPVGFCRYDDDDESSRPCCFASWADGIGAHLDRIALCAGAPGFPRPGSRDPYHHRDLWGCATTVEGFGRVWADEVAYGPSLVAHFLEPLMAASTSTLAEDRR